MSRIFVDFFFLEKVDPWIIAFGDFCPWISWFILLDGLSIRPFNLESTPAPDKDDKFIFRRTGVL